MVVEAPQDLHPLLFPRHQRHSPPCQPPITQPQSTPLVKVTDLPLFPPCQVPHHHQPRAQRHVPGKVIAAVIHAILTTTALARMSARMVSVRLALVGRIVEGSVLLMPRVLHSLALGLSLVYRLPWRTDRFLPQH